MAADQTRLSEALERFIETEFERLKQDIAQAFAKLREKTESEPPSAT